MVRHRDCRPLKAKHINAFFRVAAKTHRAGCTLPSRILLTATRGVEVIASRLATVLRIPSTLMAVLQTPHRFRDERQLWTFSGLGIETHSVVRGQGDGALALIDRTGKKIGDMAVDAHPDRFSLRRSGRESS